MLVKLTLACLLNTRIFKFMTKNIATELTLLEQVLTNPALLKVLDYDHKIYFDNLHIKCKMPISKVLLKAICLRVRFLFHL